MVIRIALGVAAIVVGLSGAWHVDAGEHQEPRRRSPGRLPDLPRLPDGSAVPLKSLPRLPSRAPSDFRVDFSSKGRLVPRGLLVGLNEYNNSWPGTWDAYGEYLRPAGGLVRLWIMFDIAPFGRQHIAAGLQARRIGMDVMLCGVGLPENHPRKADSLPDRTSKEPRDPQAWARQLARHARVMLDAGVPLTHVEIWNEPAMPGRWYVDPEPFARFYAEAGRVLRKELPRRIRIGGPGETHIGRRTLDRFRLEFEACRRVGFRPDFLSWHDYVGYPTDQEAFQFSDRVRRLAGRYGLGDAELILSEWNYTLPPDPFLDSYANGAYFVAVTTGLTRTHLQHSQFLMLQDGKWEAKQDFKGQSAGIFTLNGAPKPVFQGMQMMRVAADLPSLPVERQAAPWNLTLFASRQGDRGWLLAANAFGDIRDRTRKFLDYSGVDMSVFKNRKEPIRRYLSGRLSFERLGARPKDRAAWQQAQRDFAVHKREIKATERPVHVRLKDAPSHIRGVWVLDAQHGDPMADADFRRRFDALRSKGARRGGRAGAGGRKAQRAGGLNCDIPKQLAAHPAARPHPVRPADYLRVRDDSLVLKMTPFSALLIELSWSRQDD